jgi:hypothetical protein
MMRSISVVEGDLVTTESWNSSTARSDDFISNHSDVTGPEVAQALVAAIAVT